MLNKAILCGRLTKDPELRSSQSGVSICSFSVAVPRKYKKEGEERQVDFINCVAFRQTADFISRYFNKGNLISIDGSIQTRSWEDNDGKKRYATEVVVNDAGFVEGKKEQQSFDAPALPPERNETGTTIEDFGDIDDDDLPF